jgi:choline kinase
LKTLPEKHDFCIIVGGINKRMNIDFPKCLMVVDNEVVLMKIINNILPYANNIYICGNVYYKNKFIEFETDVKNISNIKFLYFNSCDNTQSYPKGNGETIYQLLQKENLTEKIFIMWGDIIISNNKIFEELYNCQESDFVIPTLYEKDPYAYLIIENNSVKFEYKKNRNVDYGYHDQCIFLCNTQKIKEKLILKSDEIEFNFLDIVKSLNASYYETKYPVKSFNTVDELITNQ